jgi:ribosomal protein S28E/S33
VLLDYTQKDCDQCGAKTTAGPVKVEDLHNLQKFMHALVVENDQIMGTVKAQALIIRNLEEKTFQMDVTLETVYKTLNRRVCRLEINAVLDAAPHNSNTNNTQACKPIIRSLSKSGDAEGNEGVGMEEALVREGMGKAEEEGTTTTIASTTPTEQKASRTVKRNVAAPVSKPALFAGSFYRVLVAFLAGFLLTLLAGFFLTLLALHFISPSHDSALEEIDYNVKPVLPTPTFDSPSIIVNGFPAGSQAYERLLAFQVQRSGFTPSIADLTEDAPVATVSPNLLSSTQSSLSPNLLISTQKSTRSSGL